MVTHRRDLPGRREDIEPPHSRARFDASAASTDSSSLLSAFFLERIFLTHFDVVRSRFVVLSMPNAVGKLPFPTAVDVTAAP